MQYPENRFPGPREHTRNTGYVRLQLHLGTGKITSSFLEKTHKQTRNIIAVSLIKPNSI